ncbi:MAG TPA: mannose-1-phosphate guanylyltransferase [Ignavibacteriaceae bacterium]|jgi:mannose-1-phosphate guanylyltransferase|nr:mannose-1-phosphate guanylyltransferase [Ignavibacteriaceae bacterium]
MTLFAVIMAGGIGSRFWPRSKKKTPKQLLNIFGPNTMIQETVRRLNGIVPEENIFIITNKVQRDEIVRQLPGIPEENIIEEPFGRNTAACVGLASVVVKAKCTDAVTLILPADHIIKDIEDFHKTLREAADFADKSKGLVTIGIKPTRPETGYGYIQMEENQVADHVHKVYTFAEKPNYATAVRFLESGDFYWNSGMFIWHVDAILNEIEKYMPDLHEGLTELKPAISNPDFYDALANVYGKLRNISIDYGIMEKSQNVYLIKGEFSWSDVGSWEEVYQLTNKDENGNALVGHVFTEMTVDSYIYSPDKFTSVIGVDNLIIINTDNALLVCRRDKSQDVKKIVDHLKINKLTEYL